MPLEPTPASWIELTNASDGVPVLVNLNRITVIYERTAVQLKHKPNIGAVLCSDTEAIEVREPFVVIVELVRGEVTR